MKIQFYSFYQNSYCRQVVKTAVQFIGGDEFLNNNLVINFKEQITKNKLALY